MSRVICFPQWWMLLVAILAILSGDTFPESHRFGASGTSVAFSSCSNR
jgi:hypothetical protein